MITGGLSGEGFKRKQMPASVYFERIRLTCSILALIGCTLLLGASNSILILKPGERPIIFPDAFFVADFPRARFYFNTIARSTCESLAKSVPLSINFLVLINTVVLLIFIT